MDAFFKIIFGTVRRTYYGADVFLQVELDLVVNQGVEAGADGARTCRTSDHVFENEIPTNQKRHEFSHCHVAVHVSRATRFGNANSKFAVAQTYTSKIKSHVTKTRLLLLFHSEHKTLVFQE